MEKAITTTIEILDENPILFNQENSIQTGDFLIPFIACIMIFAIGLMSFYFINKKFFNKSSKHISSSAVSINRIKTITIIGVIALIAVMFGCAINYAFADDSINTNSKSYGRWVDNKVMIDDIVVYNNTEEDWYIDNVSFNKVDVDLPNVNWNLNSGKLYSGKLGGTQRLEKQLVIRSKTTFNISVDVDMDYNTARSLVGKNVASISFGVDPIPENQHEIIDQSNLTHGSITYSGTEVKFFENGIYANADSSVLITYSCPAEDYELSSVVLSWSGGSTTSEITNNTATFNMPNANVAVNASEKIILRKIDFNDSGVQYYPVFDKNNIPANVTFYGSDDAPIYQMDPNISYAMVPKNTTITAVRSENQISWNNTFSIVDSFSYPAHAVNINESGAEGTIGTKLKTGDNVLFFKINSTETPIKGNMPTINGISVINIWNAYNPSHIKEKFGGKYGNIWCCTVPDAENAYNISCSANEGKGEWNYNIGGNRTASDHHTTWISREF